MAGISIQRPETVLFVGAGATQRLDMPTTYEQAIILWRFCEKDKLAPSDVAGAVPKIRDSAVLMSDMLNVVDSGYDGYSVSNLDGDVKNRAFPNLTEEQIEKVVIRLRRHYDWGALKLVASAKKNGSKEKNPRDEYLQEVFTLIDVCLRDNRGFQTFHDGKPIYLSIERLKAARETLVLLINTLFACAWQKLIASAEGQNRLRPYRQFFLSLAKMMQEEGSRFLSVGCEQNLPEFYQFSYAVVTTNFEPQFLWFIWNAHDKVNHGAECRLGNPGRILKLLMNFPNTIGMRKPNDVGGSGPLSPNIWFPCTDAVAQNVNNPEHYDDRIFRLGKYYPVHGMSNTRHCPVCGRLNLYMGDTWDENSPSLFPNGIIAEPKTRMQESRTQLEQEARERGEYDALQCHFCGALTHSYDNFMFMQTQLKSLPPSFIKETTDEALAVIAGAKHIVLLGYSLPLDDAIWGSLLTAMSRRRSDQPLYCSVVGYKADAPKRWMAGDELRKYVEDNKVKSDDRNDIRGIVNSIAVFGIDHVRAYMAGVPCVFGDQSISAVKNLMYPCDQDGWSIDGFSTTGVVRKGKT